MADQWFYAQGTEINGPLSGRQLADLASSGILQPADTVWKEGVEEGVAASRVRNLFLPAPSPVAASPTEEPSPIASATLPDGNTAPAALAEAESTAAVPPATDEPLQAAAPAAPKPPVWKPPPAGKARAVAGKGAVIVAQDGTTVKYRKKCTTCGYEDSCWHSLRITTGVTNTGFFCPKCRKRRDVQIQGYLG